MIHNLEGFNSKALRDLGESLNATGVLSDAYAKLIFNYALSAHADGHALGTRQERDRSVEEKQSELFKRKELDLSSGARDTINEIVDITMGKIIDWGQNHREGMDSIGLGVLAVLEERVSSLAQQMEEERERGER